MDNFIKLKNIRLKYIHIGLIILGIIFILLPAFHSNLSFDESYSVGMANHSFSEIWTIAGKGVNPILYYYILHIINLIFNNNIMIYRLFSVLCTAILAIIGFTHIRKDFGEKVGLTFSLLTLLLPVNLIYASQIKIYPLAMLLVTLTAIYAYRIYENKENYSIKNWILFTIFSLSSAYTHYYALMASVFINLILMIYLILQSIKNKELNANIKTFIICAIMQIALYIPWIITFLIQIQPESKHSWISIHFPRTIIELFTFQFAGNLFGDKYISNKIAVIFGLFITIYTAFIYIKNFVNAKEKITNIIKEMKPAILSIILFLSIAFIACIASKVLHKSLIYAEYMLCIMGLFIIFLAYTMEKKGQKYINILIYITTILISLYININLININYDKSNSDPINYIKEDIKDGDIFIIGNESSGFIISANFPKNTTHFTSYAYSQTPWNCGETYKAFSCDFEIEHNLDFLKRYTGQIWIINNTHYSLYNHVDRLYEVTFIKQKMFSTKYKDSQYSITLIDK